MKKLFLMAAASCLFIISHAQTSNPAFNGNWDNDPIAQRLVALALQNADIKISDLKIEEAKSQVWLAKTGWMNIASVSGNLNEFSINPPKGITNIYYPKYNLGVTIPLGYFITNANLVKNSRREEQIVKYQKENQQETIKNEVLSKYEDYLMYKQQLDLQSQVTENQYNSYLQTQQKFQSGQVGMDEYNSALKEYNAELTTKITLQHDLNVAQLDLEKLIKVPLQSVLTGPAGRNP